MLSPLGSSVMVLSSYFVYSILFFLACDDSVQLGVANILIFKIPNFAFNFPHI